MRSILCAVAALIAGSSATSLLSLRGGVRASPNPTTVLLPSLALAGRSRCDFCLLPQAKEKVTIVGSGNWGSAIAKIIARNVIDREEFDNEVRMWVYEEQVDGKNLTDIINTEHENVKYLPVRAGSTQSVHPVWAQLTGGAIAQPRPLSHSLVCASRLARRASNSPTTSSRIPT